MRTIHFYSRLSAIILFFFMSFLPFFFWGIDSEYNLNQQIDRGHISRNAIFFAFDNIAPKTTAFLIPDSISINLENMSDDEIDQFMEELFPELKEQKLLKDKVIINNYIEDGLTHIEHILSSGGDNYFVAVHTGRGRYFYYTGRVQLPPLLEGRFLTPEECLSGEPLAVIGQTLSKDSYLDNGKTYIDINNRAYEVIGVTGLEQPSTLDHLYFLNLGSIDPDEQIGRYYIDGLKDMKNIYNNIDAAAIELMDITIKEMTMPTTFTDAVSGNVYLKDYLKLVISALLLFIYLSILTQSILAERQKIAIIKLVGASVKKVFIRVHLPLFICGLSGILLNFLTGLVLIGTNYFALPQREVFMLLGICSLLSIAFLLIWGLVFFLLERRLELREVTQKI